MLYMAHKNAWTEPGQTQDMYGSGSGCFRCLNRFSRGTLQRWGNFTPQEGDQLLGNGRKSWDVNMSISIKP